MATKGKREASNNQTDVLRSGETGGEIRYELVSRGNDYEDTLDTERRLKEKKRQNGGRRGRGWIIAGCVLLALVVIAAAAYKLIFVRPELPSADGDKPTSSTTETDVGDGDALFASGERKSQDYYTFLLLGRDTGGGGNCDTMMLVSYDMTNQKMTVMSIPRDTMVNVSWDVKKINSVYNMNGGGDKGISALKTEISQLVGFKPDYTVIVEWEAVGKLVEAIGGVYFDVPQDMNYEDPYQDLSIHIKAGYQLLSGTDAMGVIRWRHDNSGHGYKDGDLGRIKTQQAFLKAVISQVLQVKNAGKLYDFSRIFKEDVTTELSVQNLFWLGKGAVLGGLTMDSVNFVTMPNKSVSAWSRSYGQYLSYVVPIASELLKIVNEELSPFVTPSLMSQLDIMSVNSNGSLSSTTGSVEDAKAAAAPSIPSGTDKTPVQEPEDGTGGTGTGGTGTGGTGTGGTDTGGTDTGGTDTGGTGTGGTDTGGTGTGGTGTGGTGTGGTDTGGAGQIDDGTGQ